MSHIKLSNYGQSPFEQLMGHAPTILNQWIKLEEVFFQSTVFFRNFLSKLDAHWHIKIYASIV